MVLASTLGAPPAAATIAGAGAVAVAGATGPAAPGAATAAATNLAKAFLGPVRRRLRAAVADVVTPTVVADSRDLLRVCTGDRAGVDASEDVGIALAVDDLEDFDTAVGAGYCPGGDGGCVPIVPYVPIMPAVLTQSSSKTSLSLRSLVDVEAGGVLGGVLLLVVEDWLALPRFREERFAAALEPRLADVPLQSCSSSSESVELSLPTGDGEGAQ